MTDYTVIIPTIWDYFDQILHGVPFWIGLGVMCVLTIGLSRIYRKRRGWY